MSGLLQSNNEFCLHLRLDLCQQWRTPWGSKPLYGQGIKQYLTFSLKCYNFLLLFGDWAFIIPGS